MHELERLLDHLAWADELMLGALRAAPSVDGGLLELVAHLVAAEEVWLARIEGREPKLAVWPDLDLDGCATWAERNRRAFRELIASKDEAGLAESVSYRNSAGRRFESRIDDILIHTCLHGAYHRGQVAAALRRAGDTPAPTDYIAWVRGSPAATREDSERDPGAGP